ncbi:MAG: RNA methyltransferase [Eudoraea sp.]|nr:RNA methyltransferase [Eudoraea sp.]
MVVKSQLKYIKSLQQKKYRLQHNRFVAEGFKTVNELLQAGWKTDLLLTTEKAAIDDLGSGAQLISEKQMSQISSLKTPSQVLGVFEIPPASEIDYSDWIVALDKVRDPGNLGTIIRLCDWFGLSHLVCSRDTVEAFNPKVLQATMGSIARVNLHYVDLPSFLEDADVPVLGAFMDGNSVYQEALPESGIMVMGNEANGISAEVSALIDKRISIPQYGNPTAESLNVATATAILLNEIRR